MRKFAFALLSAILFIIPAFESLGQNVVRGTIKDGDGEPLIGSTIRVEGTSQGTVTDIDGKYALEVNDEDAVLVFTFVGMESKKVKVENKTRIDVVLKEDVNELEGVVITGYQDIKERFFTGAAQSIKAEDIKLDGIPDIGRMLEGRAAGVSIQNVTGTFGASPRITIRGSSSILGNNRPIWVIDGAIQEEIVNISLSDLVSGDSNTLLSSAVSGLSATDIKSIEVLKDASATALYGARALNGVVVITTKSGKRNQKTSVTYSGEFSMRPVPTYANQNLLNSKETMAIYQQMESSYLRIEQSLQNRYGGAYNAFYNAVNTYNPETGTFLAENNPSAKASFLQRYELANTDWFNVLFRNTPTQTHSLSFTGGGEKTAQYASISYYYDPGWTIADKVDRITGNLRSIYYFNDKLKATLQFRGSVRNQNAPGTFQAVSDNFTGGITRDFDINPFSYAINTTRALRVRNDDGELAYSRYNWAPFNILNELENNKIELNVLDLKVQAELEYSINEHIKYNFLGTARFAKSTSQHMIKENSNVVGAYNANQNTIIGDANTFLYEDTEDPEALPVVVLPNGGIYNKRENNLTTYTMRNTIDYEYDFNKSHSIRVYAGQELRFTDRQATSNDGYGYQYAKGGVVFTDPRIFQKLAQNGTTYFSANTTKERGLTFFATGTYSFKEKYVINITGNYEGSNRAGKSESARWLPTYNVGAKWNIDKESFMDNVEWISKLAFRPSYGLTALIADNVSNNLVIYENQITDRFLPSNRENQTVISDLQNSNLTWEKNYELNLGWDIGLFNNSVGLTFDAYFRNGVDLIDGIRTSAIGGQVEKLANNANMTTQGVEFQVNTTNLTTKNFRWTTTLNLSHYIQEITRLAQKPNVFDLVSRVGGSVIGRPRGVLYSYQFDGLTSEGLPTFFFHDDRDPIEGIDFQETIDIEKYLKYEGPVEPNFSGGIANTFSYKNWSLSFFITFQGGNVIRLNPAFAPIRQFSDLAIFTKDYQNRWLIEGDELTTNFPTIPSERIVEKYGASQIERLYNAYNYSDQRIADGGFVRLKNISLSYSTPKKILDKLRLSTLRVSFQATNPLLIYSDPKLRGQDPEFFNTGGVASPITRQYTLSLNIGI